MTSRGLASPSSRGATPKGYGKGRGAAPAKTSPAGSRSGAGDEAGATPENSVADADSVSNATRDVREVTLRLPREDPAAAALHSPEATPRSVSPVAALQRSPRELSAGAGAAKRLSWLERVDGNIEDLQAFERWASANDGWGRLHQLFYNEVRDTYVHGGFYGEKRVTLAEFLSFCNRYGAASTVANLDGIFDLILQECQTSRDVQNARLDPGGHTSMTLRQLKRFQSRLLGKAGCGNVLAESPAVRLSEVLKERYGTQLRAWRVLFDRHEHGQIHYAHFCAGCRELGDFGPRPALAWAALLRPAGGEADVPPGSPRSHSAVAAGARCAVGAAGSVGAAGAAALPQNLRFCHLCAEEAANLEEFVAILWKICGLDFRKLYALMDEGNRGHITLEEFSVGVKTIGFTGDATMLFKGLDKTGVGYLFFQDLEYLGKVSDYARTLRGYKIQMNLQVINWMQMKGISAVKLMELLGLSSTCRSIQVSALSSRLRELGFEGDAFSFARWAARDEGSCVSVDTLFRLLTAEPKREPPPHNPPRLDGRRKYRARTERRARHPRPFDNRLHYTSETNYHRIRGKRNYFSDYCRDGERHMYRDDLGAASGRELPLDAATAAATSARTRSQPLLRSASLGRQAAEGARTWNEHEYNVSEHNRRLFTDSRTLFGDPRERPTLEEQRRRMEDRGLHTPDPWDAVLRRAPGDAAQFVLVPGEVVTNPFR
eukprot:TRINITY_DN1971_c0_g5_i1.p1 TRINITY_DN1971_c0_g5~~TRINITY_DN1971_c0_g5_i1.p1  ORF type:complete len:730 (-),score=162.69 TRINITY_DN1971_c0_g5_i1:189-2336(-)